MQKLAMEFERGLRRCNQVQKLRWKTPVLMTCGKRNPNRLRGTEVDPANQLRVSRNRITGVHQPASTLLVSATYTHFSYQ